MKIISPEFWKDYELIDSGGLEKLERFGKYILARPEPQAVWSKAMTEADWESMFHARYKRIKGNVQGKTENFEKGEWIRKKSMTDQWMIGYSYHDMNLRFRLGLTAFGHIGIFPEQAENWNYIFDIITHQLTSSPAHQLTNAPSRVLNLFAYTGGASLAARAAGADVVHVDSVKPVINWAKEMMESSGLEGIHWVVEDALKFVKREVKRGNKYQGIILDPPAYGRGPEGEKWILEDSINTMVMHCKSLLDAERGFFIMSLYSMGLSSLVAESLIRTHFNQNPTTESGELFFYDKKGRKLPLGTYIRFSK